MKFNFKKYLETEVKKLQSVKNFVKSKLNNQKTKKQINKIYHNTINLYNKAENYLKKQIKSGTKGCRTRRRK